jgi:hypothetical protein
VVLYLCVTKPCHGPAIGGKHGAPRDVQSQSAVLDRRPNGRSKDENRPSQRIKFSDVDAGIDPEEETHAPLRIIVSYSVFAMQATQIFVRWLAAAYRIERF